VAKIQVSFWVFSSTGKIMHTETKVFSNTSAAAEWLILAHKDYPRSTLTDKVQVLDAPLGDEKARALVRRTRAMVSVAL